MKTTLLATLTVFLSLGLGLVLAQDDEEAARAKKIEEFIQKGLVAHRANQPQEAITQLQQAVMLLQKSIEKDLAAFLPQPREGWTADDPEVQSGMWGTGEQTLQFTTATRSYSREEDGRSVEIVLTNSPQMVGMQKQLITTFQNPQMAAMLGADEDREIETFKEEGWDGMLTVEKEGDAQLMAVSGDILITIQVDAPDADLVREFWKAVDREALAALAKAK